VSPDNQGAALNRLREALEDHGCKPRGSDALCPAHEDTHPSLKFGAKTRGRPGAMLYCHAGCLVVDIVSALDLTMDDLFDEPWQPALRSVPARTVLPDGTPVALGEPFDLLDRGLLRGLRCREAFRIWDGRQFAHLVAGTDPGDWEARVRRAEDGCRLDASEWADKWRPVVRVVA
jgi:hypothetical protein